MARSRSGAVLTRRIAEQGTGTWAILQIMNKYLLDNPGDVDGAAREAQTKGRNLGLANPVWDEHGDETCKLLYNRYIQPYEEKAREVPPDVRDKYPNPHRPLTSQPEREGEEAPPTFTPPEPEATVPEIVMGAAARKYYLATEGGKPSQQREIGLWSHEDILAKIGVFENIISGNTRSLEAWVKLAGLVPPGRIVKDFVTNAQLEELGLKP